MKIGTSTDSTALVTQLEAEEKRLSLEILAVQKRLYIARCEVAGIKEGDIVTYKGVEHRVTKVEPEYGFNRDKPWVSGNPKKKDGTFSMVERHLYTDWVKQ